MRRLVLAVISLVAMGPAAMGQAALGQGTETWVKAPPAVLQKATADTIEVSLNVLESLAVSEPSIVAPEGAPRGGMVAMKVLVSKTGAVEEVAASMGDGALRKVASDGVMGWKYRPYLVDGAPRDCQSTILIRFRDGVGRRVTAMPMGAMPNVGPFGGTAGMAGSPPNTGVQSGVASLGDPTPVSAGVIAGLLSQPVAPVYPAIARAAHIQGVMVLHAILSRTGKVESLQVISGPPLLQQAAIDAVSRWVYRPYKVDGVPTEVATTINVNFQFADPLKPAGVSATPEDKK